MSIYKGDNLIVGIVESDTDLVRSLHDPDWSQGVVITVDQLIAGYTTPGRGVVVGYVIPGLTEQDTVDITVNNIVITRAYRSSDGNPSMATISANVCKDDIIKSTNALIGSASISFVPYKKQ